MIKLMQAPGRTFAAVALALCAALPVAAQMPAVIAYDPGAAAAGNDVLNSHCAGCHGKNGRGGRAPELTAGELRSGGDAESIYRVIANGIPGTDMPAWNARIKPPDIWRIVAFLRSVRNTPAARPGDTHAGESLFWGKGNCGRCHAVAGRGNLVGPDLTHAGAALGSEYIRQTIMRPALSADRDEYRGVTVITRDGTKITGIEKALDDFSVVLIGFDGRVRSFDRASVRSVERETRSLMPAYADVFSPAELENLLAYLETLTGAVR